jgi:hypothetical protein
MQFKVKNVLIINVITSTGMGKPTRNDRTLDLLCLASCLGLMTDSAVVDSALVDAALRKSGLISNGKNN